MKNIYNIPFLLFTLFLGLSSYGQSLEFDRFIGEENAKLVESEMGIYDDKVMTAYIDKLGQKLVSHLDNPLFKYQFKLVPDFAPNAFALPGGYIYVTTGIIPLLKSEDELACILAHEIIHSNNRHSIKQIKKSIVPHLFEIPGKLLGLVNEDLGTLFNKPIKTSNKLIFASYSRKFETEADKQGITIAAAAGYNPYAMTLPLSRMDDAIEEATGYNASKSYFADHPYTPDRIKNIKSQAKNLNVGTSKPISNNFLFEFDGILFGKSPSKGIVRENKFLHPDFDFFIEFPVSWEIENELTNIVAYHPDQKAAVFLSLEKAGMTPEQAGKVFLENLDNKYKELITDSKTYNFKGKKGYLISYTETIKKETIYAYLLWLPLKDKLFKIVGITPIELRDELETSALSLRHLTNLEKQSIKQSYVKVVKARQNETLEELSNRTKNKLNLNLTRIINSINPGDTLEKGRLVKIILEKQYITK